jgi:organic radical activating enzyme
MENYIDKLKNSNAVVIFGARLVGRCLLKRCQELNIKVHCFCDDNINRTKMPLDGVPVLHSSAAQLLFPNAMIIISAADIRDVRKRVIDLGWTQWISAIDMLQTFDPYQYNWGTTNPGFVKYTVDTCLLCQSNALQENKVFMRSIDIVVTERCSMKCKECSNLMQYYKQPKTYSWEEMEKSIAKFLEIVDEVNEARVIGGEPLVNKECHKVVKMLNDSNKIHKTLVYTNATIAPRDEQMLDYKNTKTIFYITDYGTELSKNKPKMIEQLEKHGITYYVNPAQNWTKCSTLDKKNRTDEANRIIFEACCSKNTTTLLDGVLYRCPFSANADKLRSIPDFPQDRLDLNKLGTEETKKTIKPWLLDKDFIEACDHCNGRSFDDPEIVAAEQVNKPLDYFQYER